LKKKGKDARCPPRCSITPLLSRREGGENKIKKPTWVKIKAVNKDKAKATRGSKGKQKYLFSTSHE